MIAIGIDTGGTCTDAVVYDIDKKEILAAGKSLTDHEHLENGIRASLKKLPRKWIEQAQYISLSTTLATNACVENKGGRVCLLFIGVSPETVLESYSKYGFDGTDFMRFLKGDITRDEKPDWEVLEAMIPDIVEQYDSIAIAQIQPKENGGAYEKEAKKRIRRHTDMPVVCAYEIFQDLNVIKRGAGALLNARLIPVIQRFFDAVKQVLAEENIKIPFVIMRSDGSLVSEQYSSRYPVETLLCGPTASVKGGMELLFRESAVIIDMGGTTSDIALVRNGQPVMDENGIRVGNWQTFVRGIAIDTFALGGDTRVGYHNRELLLQNRRVVPISLLAHKYADVCREVETIASLKRASNIPLYEHLILRKDIHIKKNQYTQQERDICELLKNGPKSMRQISKETGIDVYMLHTQRLEDEGVVQRSGFTPTDAMILQGDYKCYEPDAARAVLTFLARCTRYEESEIAQEVYRLVKEKLYCNLVRILWKDAHKNASGQKTEPELLQRMAKETFTMEMSVPDGQFFGQHFYTNAALIGVGAPIHVFLPDVAKALHTECLLSDYSGVSNAIGAMLGDVCAIESVEISIQYVIGGADVEKENYKVYVERTEVYNSYEEALERAKEIARVRAHDKAVACGAAHVYEVTVKEKKNYGKTNLGQIFMGSVVTATARGTFGVQQSTAEL